MTIKKITKGTFLDEDTNPILDKSDAAMLGIGFDLTASFAKGTRLGPQAILSSTRQTEFETPANGKRLDEKIKVHNLGLFEFNYKNNLSEKQIEKETRKMIDTAKKELKKAVEKQKYLIVFGGDHSTTNVTLQALSEKINPKEICWLRLDAHLDLRNALEDNPVSHGSIGRRVFDKGAKQIFIGIRDHISIEEAQFLEQNNLVDDVFYCPTQPKQLYEKKLPNWIEKENLFFNGKISEKQMNKILSKIDKKYLFINIDIDALDANDFPGTGTPMPFGLSTKEMNDLLFSVIEHAKKNGIKILGFDIVEVFPLLKNEKKGYSIENAITTGNEMKAALLAYNLLYWSFLERFY